VTAVDHSRATRDEHGRLSWEPRAGDVVLLRCPHACGESRMVLTQLGLDARLSCTGCGRKIVLDRRRLAARVVDVLGEISDFPQLGRALETEHR
jgi:hypothetical protein